MKKFAATALAIFALFSLGACTKNNQNTTKESVETSMTSKKEQPMERTSSSTEKEKSQSVFRAVLAEDAKKKDTVDQSIRLVLKKVEAVDDPEKIVNMMKNDGVILNVSNEQLADGVTEGELKTGDKIQFTLVSLPAMMMSIPPQVAGNSVIKVEKK